MAVLVVCVVSDGVKCLWWGGVGVGGVGWAISRWDIKDVSFSCLQSETGSGTLRLVDFIGVVDIPACVRAHASTCKLSVRLYLKMCFLLQTRADLAISQATARTFFDVWCGGCICCREMRGDNLSCSLI